MNLSLKNRIMLCFALANVMVLAIGLTVFHFLGQMSQNIENISKPEDSHLDVSIYIDDLRAYTIELIKEQRKLYTLPGDEKITEKMQEICDRLLTIIQTIQTDHASSGTGASFVMTQHIDQVKFFLQKGSFKNINWIEDVSNMTDKILDSFSEIQNLAYDHERYREAEIKKIIEETKLNMLYTLILTFLATLLLGLIIPSKIALPFKKINDAIRELQDCNFDISIFYNQDDELGEMAQEMNKMITNLKKFEQLRSERILIEGRKFDALANLSKLYVLVANAKTELIYMNSALFSLLGVRSEDVLDKSLKQSKVPESISSAFALAIKRRSKIENSEIIITKTVKQMDEEGHETDVEENIFAGHATVIPVRGKDSAHDYYLMVVSTEVFE